MNLYSTTYKNLYRVVSGTITINNDDCILYCDTSSGAVTINLIDIPSNYWSTQYKLYVVDFSDNAGTNNITINAPTGFTINNSSSLVLNVNGASAIVRISGNTTYISEISNSGSSATPFEGTNWSFVYGNGSHTANATQLQNAYTSAKTKTPNGSPLSATNRFTIIVGSGYYSFSSNFLVDTNFIDIVSLTGNCDVIFNGVGTLVNSVTNVFLKGIDVGTKNFSLTSANPSSVNICENCKGGEFSFGYNIAIAGTFKNCVGGDLSFGGGSSGTASGTYTDCVGTTSSFGGFGGIASGNFTNCTGGQYSFGGGGGTASGVFTNCTGTNYSFAGGGSGIASGTFINCNGLSESFGGGSLGNSSGTFQKCIGGNLSFGGDGTASGTFNNCVGGNYSFGGDNGSGGVASGTFNNCVGGDNSYGESIFGVSSPTLNNCVGGTNSFGVSAFSGKASYCIGGSGSFASAGTLRGQLYWCRLTSGTFATISSGGRTIYCIDGSNNTNNQ
jgi:hypothetical protein